MLGLNVEGLIEHLECCPDFRNTGQLHSARGVLSASLRAELGELCEIHAKSRTILAEAIGFSGDQTQILPFDHRDDLRPGLAVHALGRRLSVPTGAPLLGRVINGFGEPIDQAGPIVGTTHARVTAPSPPPLERPRISKPLVTGIRVIDSLMTLGHGQRIALLAGAGVGKSTLLGEIAKGSSADVNVVALIGERGREVKPFIEDCLGRQGREKSVVIVATADEQPLMRIRAANAAIAIAANFRERGKNVLFMIDSITRLATAQREIGLLLGEPPTLRGYTPSVFQLLASFLEQMGASGNGTMSSVINVLVDGDDIDEPIADAVRAIVDGHIVLDRELAQHGHYPAINIGKSLSRVFQDITEPSDQKAATHVRDILATYAEVEELLRVGAYVKGTSSRIDKAIHLKTAIDDFVRQNIGERTAYKDTRAMLRRIAAQWNE